MSVLLGLVAIKAILSRFNRKTQKDYPFYQTERLETIWWSLPLHKPIKLYLAWYYSSVLWTWMSIDSRRACSTPRFKWKLELFACAEDEEEEEEAANPDQVDNEEEEEEEEEEDEGSHYLTLIFLLSSFFSPFFCQFVCLFDKYALFIKIINQRLLSPRFIHNSKHHKNIISTSSLFVKHECVRPVSAPLGTHKMKDWTFRSIRPYVFCQSF